MQPLAQALQVNQRGVANAETVVIEDAHLEFPPRDVGTGTSATETRPSFLPVRITADRSPE
jgi:hypothetical protein